MNCTHSQSLFSQWCISFFYADVHMPELSAEGDTAMEGLTLFMIKPYFFSREVCLSGQQRMRRQV